MIHTMFNKLLVKGNKLCRTCCLTEFECDYVLVNGMSCWPVDEAPNHLIVQFREVRRCCDDTLIEELNTKHCISYYSAERTYFGCVENVDIDGSLYNLILAFGDAATNTWSDIFVVMNAVNCIWNRWPTSGCLFYNNIVGEPCPPTTRNNQIVAAGNCGGSYGVLGTFKGYGGTITPIDPSGQL